jgi:hypothetical protein
MVLVGIGVEDLNGDHGAAQATRTIRPCILLGQRTGFVSAQVFAQGQHRGDLRRSNRQHCDRVVGADLAGDFHQDQEDLGCEEPPVRILMQQATYLVSDVRWEVLADQLTVSFARIDAELVQVPQRRGHEERNRFHGTGRDEGLDAVRREPVGELLAGNSEDLASG